MTDASFHWKITAPSGTLWATVEGPTREAAAQTLAQVLQEIGVTIIALQVMKREGPSEQGLFIYFHNGQRNVNAGRGVWAALGHLAEYEALVIMAKDAWTHR